MKYKYTSQNIIKTQAAFDTRVPSATKLVIRQNTNYSMLPLDKINDNVVFRMHFNDDNFQSITLVCANKPHFRYANEMPTP